MSALFQSAFEQLLSLLVNSNHLSALTNGRSFWCAARGLGVCCSLTNKWCRNTQESSLRSVVAMAKVDGALKPFRDRSDDFDEFWQKFQVVCKIQKLATGKDRMGYLPLYLSGEAFTVWSGMSDSDKDDETKVKERLEMSFSMLPGEAFALFVRRKKRVDESVDSYLADLRRLMRISGHKEADGGKDPMLLEQFLAGFPAKFADQLRLNIAASSGGLDVAAVANQARALCASGVSSGEPVTAAVRHGSSSVMCYHCHATGHLRRDCPQRQKSENLKRVQCFKCKEFGHMKRDCKSTAGNGVSAGVSEDTSGSSGSKTNVCLGLSARAGVPLPRIYVCADGCPERLSAAIDSCSSRSLISKQTINAYSIPVVPVPVPECITAIDGMPLDVVGVADLTISRKDDKVRLPTVSAKFLVVESLDVVSADLLVGLDIISSTGGVKLQYSEADGALTHVLFGKEPGVAAAAGTTVKDDADPVMPRHISVTQDGGVVTLTMSDGEARFDPQKGYWEVKWFWKAGEEPSEPLGSGVTAYSRKSLSPEQEEKFCREVDSWVEKGWLVPYDAQHHGPPGAVLPILASCQEHKLTTPIRPCLDYRTLNDHVVSKPGKNAPACGDTIRKWRQRDTESKVLDISKAFLNVHIHPSLQRFQVVVWRDKQYVMERMGFGLTVAPKMMDAIVKWVIRGFPNTDNYIDDIVTPGDQADVVAAELKAHGLPTKPATEFSQSSVLGLMLSTSEGKVKWRRREGVDLSVPAKLTRRSIFGWCGRLTSHYPVCGWLRPVSSWLKRLAVAVTEGWDDIVPDDLQVLCQEVEQRVGHEDPVHGFWSNPVSSEWKVWCDASSIAYGVVLQAGQVVMEDQGWLRPSDDQAHINVAELGAVIKGLNLATYWDVKELTVVTDSKTVFGWLRALLDDTKRVKVSGLHEVVVARRLQGIDDLIATTQMKVSVEWVPSRDNLADKMTRVPGKFVQYWKDSIRGTEVQVNAAAPIAGLDAEVISPLSLSEIRKAQEGDTRIVSILQQVRDGGITEPGEFEKVKTQLVIVDNVLMRSTKSPLDGMQSVPVIPSSLIEKVLQSGHIQTGHAGWGATVEYLRRRCFFPGMSRRCQEFVQHCSSCVAANPRGGATVPPTRGVLPSRPWSCVQIDTLELGGCRHDQYRCVLVCVDMFTRWVEIVPLRRHDAASVSAAFVSMCTRWGPPEVVRSDNGSEFVNSVMTAVYQAFGVEVRRGAVRHPQSQGMAERFNRTLLTLVRKTLEEADDWKTAIDLLLYFYRVRPHVATKLSPMEAMVGWEPNNLLVQMPDNEPTLSAWVDRQRKQAARIRDFVEEELSAHDFLDAQSACPYQVGDRVLLRRPSRHQKLQAPFESGWTVSEVIAPSTVKIIAPNHKAKIVNVDILKLDPQTAEEEHSDVDVDADDQDFYQVLDEADEVAFTFFHDDEETVAGGGDVSTVGGYALRNRDGLRPPQRFR